MFKFLQKPYPYLFNYKRNLIIALLVSLFVVFSEKFFVLNTPENPLIKHIHYFIGFSTFISMIFVFEVLMRFTISQKKKENWCIKHEIITISILILFLSVSNYITFTICNGFPQYLISIKFFLNSLLWTYIVGLVPTSLIIWINYNIILKRNLNESREYNILLKQKLDSLKKQEKGERIKLNGNLKNESISIDANSIVLVSSEGNYVEIYSETSDKIEKKLYRVSLQKMEDTLNSLPHLFRVHRSYIVNTRKITFTSGTARDFILHFDKIDFKVPVSRGKYKELLQLIEL